MHSLLGETASTAQIIKMRIEVISSDDPDIYPKMIGEAKPMGKHGYEVTFPEIERATSGQKVKHKNVTVYLTKKQVVLLPDKSHEKTNTDQTSITTTGA